MPNRKAPYIHEDGSSCWTKDCSRGHIYKTTSGGEAIQVASARIQSVFDSLSLHSVPKEVSIPSIASLNAQFHVGQCSCGHSEAHHGNIGDRVCLKWKGGDPDNGNAGAVPCGCKHFDGMTDGKEEAAYQERQRNARELIHAPVDPLEELVGESDSPMNETEGDFNFWQSVFQASNEGAIKLPLEVEHPELSNLTDGLEKEFDDDEDSYKDKFSDGPRILIDGYEDSDGFHWDPELDPSQCAVFGHDFMSDGYCTVCDYFDPAAVREEEPED